MKKVVAGILTLAVVFTIVGGVQYTNKPDTYALDVNASQEVNL
ncbi:NprX family peptide pheromone [Bacillus mobilis]